MYSNSSSFIGGGNSSRPGAPQYGQSFQQQLPQPQQHQPHAFTQQPTGFQTNPMQTQYTGLPGQTQLQSPQGAQQQTQFTGYPAQNQQTFPGGPQPTAQNTLPPTPMAPRRTGQTSSQIAQSFQPTGSTQQAAPKSSAGVKIPKIRLSFLTAQDQAKFEQLFKSAVGDSQALDGRIDELCIVMTLELIRVTGEKVRDLLIRSKLPGNDLAHIWFVCPHAS